MQDEYWLGRGRGEGVESRSSMEIYEQCVSSLGVPRALFT